MDMYYFCIWKKKNLSTTIQAVKDKLGVECQIAPGVLKTLVDRTLGKYQNLGRESDMKKFQDICHEVFTLFTCFGDDHTSISLGTDDQVQPKPEEPIPSTSTLMPVTPKTELVLWALAPTDHQSTSSSTPVALTPLKTPLLRYVAKMTPQKVKLRKRLEFVSKSKSTMQHNYRENIKVLRAKLRKPDRLKHLKHLNQVIKRKENTIRNLKEKMKTNNLVNELEAMRAKLNNARQNYQRMKNYKKLQVIKNSCQLEDEVIRLEGVCKSKHTYIVQLENDKLVLEETIKYLHASGSGPSVLKHEGKTFSSEVRMLVYDSIINHVPTKNIPLLLEKFAKRTGMQLERVPHRSTVEMMARELGVISDIKVAEFLLDQVDSTIGFDATTQEGAHVNSIHVTSKDECNIISIDQLPGGTAEDYEIHITESINRVADVYCKLHEMDYEACRCKIILNISNTMTDRAAVNHATIVRLEAAWGKSLNEFNCHLHPLETVARTSRTALNSAEAKEMKGKLYGNDCIAGNIVLAINKFRYKDGKGDPKGFITFLADCGLPKGIIPRYRGNRLHILFHICGKLVEHHALFLKNFQTGTSSLGGLQLSLATDFDNPVAKVEIQILGLIGKLLSGPWMARFYTSASKQINHVDGIQVVKDVICVIKEFIENPSSVLTTTTDFFGDELAKDSIIQKLQVAPADDLFLSMMKSCLSGIVGVLERQYKHYFETNITEQLYKESESARCHNIDAEEIMGMFSAAKEHSPNATLCYLSSRIRAQKNRVVDYLDKMDPEKRDKILQFAITKGRKQRQTNRKKCTELHAELSKRINLKQEKKQAGERQKVEKRLKKPNLNVSLEFPELEESVQKDLLDILEEKIVGRQICHIWFDRDTKEKTIYNGKIEKLKKKAGGTYVVGYWSLNENYDDDAVDYDVSKYQLAADLVYDDLTLS